MEGSKSMLMVYPVRNNQFLLKSTQIKLCIKQILEQIMINRKVCEQSEKQCLILLLVKKTDL